MEVKEIVDKAISKVINIVSETDVDPETVTVVILSQIDKMQKCTIKGNLQSMSELFLSLMIRVPDMRTSMIVAINAFDNMQKEMANKTKS